MTLKEYDKASPLKIFVLAKKDINALYVELANYIENALKFSENVNFLTQEHEYVDTLKDLNVKTKGIIEILARNHMKVAFFGRTSNGKSTVINSMLGERVLPAGIGHTTSCFVQVEGYGGLNDKDLEPYSYVEGDFKIDGSIARKSITSVEQLANALTSENLSQDSLVHVCWPKCRCTLLRDDVVLVDSPGIDVSPDVDQWIDRHCQDADVFILVANAESTLMQTEKNFFHKVATKFSAPNIFVLNNRWDASSYFEADIIQRVKKQHTERVVHFLTSELGVMTESETADRIFFISAKEALEKRLLHNDILNSPVPGDAKTKNLKRRDDDVNLSGSDSESRWAEFLRFEIKFEECISRSAIKTKFEKHTLKAKQMIESLGAMLADQIKKLEVERESLVARNVRNHQRVRTLEQGLHAKVEAFEGRVEKLSDIVKHQVRLALDVEIKRLGILVDEFDWKGNGDYKKLAFADPYRNADHLRRYKQELERFVEEGLSRNLSSRCLADTLDYLVRFKRDLNESFKEILEIDITDPGPGSISKDGAEAISNRKAAATFDLFARDSLDGAAMGVISPDTSAMLKTAFHLDCEDLWKDFHGNLDFKFSLSPARLIKRLLIPFLNNNNNKDSASSKKKKLLRGGKAKASSSRDGERAYPPQPTKSKTRVVDGRQPGGGFGDNTPIMDRPEYPLFTDLAVNQTRRSSLPHSQLQFNEETSIALNPKNEATSNSPTHITYYSSSKEEDEEGEDSVTLPIEELRNLSLVLSSSLFGMSSAGTSLLCLFIGWKMVNSVIFYRFPSASGGGHDSPLFMKLMLGAGVTYGALYAYERLTWTPGAKEKLFKQQFVLHGIKRLRLVASRAAVNCASHVTADANRSLTRFVGIANAHKKSLEIAARSDFERREACDQLIAERYPLLESMSSKLVRSVQIFLDTYFHQN